MFSQKGENLIGVNSDRDSRAYSWSLFNTLCTVSKKEFSNFPHAHVSDLNAATRATLAQINHISVSVFTALWSEMHCDKGFCLKSPGLILSSSLAVLGCLASTLTGSSVTWFNHCMSVSTAAAG